MQWAQFKDPDGEIHDAQNYLQGPQSEKPGKDFVDNDYWKQIYGSQGWRLVDDDYRPPVSQLSLIDRIAAIEREYEPQRKTLLEYIQTASAMDLPDLVDELKVDFQALVAERDQKIEEVLNGGNGAS